MLRQVKRVSKFWREYAGSKSVQDIGDQDLKQFVAWRRDYYATRPIPQNGKRHPTDKTIQWEVAVWEGRTEVGSRARPARLTAASRVHVHAEKVRREAAL